MGAQWEVLEDTIAQNHTNEEQLRGETILFVEDEVFVREVTCEVLRSAGYRVLTAKDAIEGAQAYEQNCGEVALLLTDVILPGETGRMLAARLRCDNPGLKVLLVTGYAEQMELREEGCAETLVKPFSAGALLRRVREAIDCGGFQATSEERENGFKRAGGRV
jgi:CheY-like chemotaxis protein